MATRSSQLLAALRGDGPLLRRLLPLLRPEAAPLALAVACSSVLALSTSALALVMGPLLRAVLLGTPPTDPGWAGDALRLLGESPDQLSGWVRGLPLLLVAAAALKALTQFGQGFLLQRTAVRASARLRRELHDRLLAAPVPWVRGQHSGELFARFGSDVAVVEQALSQGLLAVGRDAVALLTLLATCAALDARLLGVILLAGPLAAWPISRFAKRVGALARSSQGVLGEATTLVAETLSLHRVIQAHGAEGQRQEAFIALQERYLGQMRRSFFLRAAFTPVLEMLGVLGLALGIGLGARAIAAGSISADHLLSFLAAALLLYQPVKSLSQTGQLFLGAQASVERLEPWLAAPVELRPAQPVALPGNAAVRFVEVGFRHAPEREEAVRGLSFTLAPGERLALVGPTGSGKSTVAALLAGFERPTRGAIEVGGVALGALAPETWHRQLAWVSQEPWLVAGTVAENLRLGEAGREEGALWAALDAAGARAFVEAMPGGLQATLSERGQSLSGGQRQRLALARALLRDAPLVVLDEATSALDAETEAAVAHALRTLLKGRSALVIAHRLATIRDCDRILVLEQGRLVEEGSHDALLARDGLYAQLWRSHLG